MQRYFALSKKENKMLLSEGDLYHITRVMRMKEQDKIEVVFEQKLYLCSIQKENDKINILIEEELETKKDFMKQVILLLPILKEQKMDLILQKVTELGVSDIIPVALKRCVVKIDSNKQEKKLERWQKILKEASEQSMRHIVPTLHPISNLNQIKELKGTKLLCSTKENKNTLKFFLQTHTNYDKLIIGIGPEGGFDIEEEQELCNNGFIPVTLGPRILRVETVPIYLLSILNYEYME